MMHAFHKKQSSALQTVQDTRPHLTRRSRLIRSDAVMEVSQHGTQLSTGKKEAVVLPPSMKNQVVVLDALNADGDSTKVYLMGVSHVSKLQAAQVKELIHLVQPEVVMLELCKDRTGLLVNDGVDSPISNKWHVRKISFEGLPTDPDWPPASDLKKLLVTRPGRPVSMQDIEGDVNTLLSTGLFKSVKPGAAAGTIEDAPHFAVTSPGTPSSPSQLLTVPPLGGVRFTVQPRELPPITEFSVRVDSSLMGVNLDESKLVEIAEQAIREVRGGEASLLVLLRTRRRFSEAVGSSVASTTVYSGVESGRVEAILKAVKPSDGPFLSGFEAGALNGAGWGIEPFRPLKPLHKLSNKMFLPAAVLEELKEQPLSSSSSRPVQSSESFTSVTDRHMEAQPRSQYRIWTDEEMAAAKRSDPDPVPIADVFRATFVLLYSKIQAEIGRKVGIERGAAWQAALQAATDVGCQHIILSDRPTAVTSRRLGDNMLMAAGGRLGAALTVLLGSISTALIVDSPMDLEAGAVAASALISGVLAWPVFGPFLEIRRLASMSADDIEEAVRVKVPLGAADLSTAGNSGKLFGEDALLDWPGATTPLLDERDEFMAKAAATVASGSAQGLCPAYVLDRMEGQLMWRLMQAEGAPAEASPSGYGDGAYKPLKDVRTVVKVVGAVHVQGIVKKWEQAVKAPLTVEKLLRDIR